MPPKKKVKGETSELEDMIQREVELKIVIEGKNEAIKALKSQVAITVKYLKKVIDDDKKDVNRLREHLEAVERQAVEADKEVNALKRKLKVVDKLKDNVECPVCLEIPWTGPVPVCPNGHLVCRECKRATCPTCRVQMGNGQSLLAVTILENIDHKCRFNDCDDYFPMDKVEEHVKVCSHRTVTCPYAHCKDKQVGLSKLLNHLNADCSYDLAPKIIDCSFLMEIRNFEIKEEQKAGPVYWKLNTFSYGDVSFGIFVEKHDEKYFFCSAMFSSERECSKYKIDMAVHEKDSSREDSEVCFRFDGKPFSIDGEKKEFLHLGLSVSDKQMEQILKKSSNSFSVSLYIRKTG